MKLVGYNLLSFLLVLASCNNRDVKYECPEVVEVDEFSSHNYVVHYELRKYRKETGENKIQNGLIKLDLKSNSKNITPVNIDDSTLLGVEVVVHELIWRKDTSLVYNIFYYELSLNNSWIPLNRTYSPNQHYFRTKLIQEKLIRENDDDIYEIEDAIVFEEL